MAVWHQRCLVPLTLLLVLDLGSVAVHGDLNFYLGSCAANRGRQDKLRFVNSAVSPYPLVLPGDFAVTSTLQVTRNITGSLTLDVTIRRHLLFFDIQIPCIGGVGTCQIRDVCGLLRDSFGNDAGCPPPFRRDGVPCTCPVAPGTYTLRGGVFRVPYLNSVWAWLAQGDYTATARLIDDRSGEVISCQRLDLTIEAPCDNFFCRFFGL